MAFDLTTFVTSVTFGGVSAAAVTQFFGGKIIDNRFATRLEASKQELQRQLEASRQAHSADIERMKFKVAGLLDRATKLNEREFEVLPEIWTKLDEAYRWAHDLISPMRSYPNMSRMEEDRFDAFISNSFLKEWQQKAIKALPIQERTAFFAEASSWYELGQATDAAHELNSALTKGGIYIDPDVFTLLQEFTRFLSVAVHQYSVEKRHNFHKSDEDEDIRAFRENGEAKFNDLSILLRNRYWRAADL